VGVDLELVVAVAVEGRAVGDEDTLGTDGTGAVVALEDEVLEG